MQSPDATQSPKTPQPDSFLGKINLFAAGPSGGQRQPITSNDAFRFQVGVNYKAKLIGVEEVESARGDQMCQTAIQKQKAFIKATGAHKQKININVSLEGIKLVDQLTGATLHHHPVQRISFISRDVSDARAFGYIYGPGDGTHKFFGIKTEKAAENVVLTLRDLFQVVFEMKKKESEDEKKLKLDNRETSKTEEKTTTQQEAAPVTESPPEKKEEPASAGLMGLEAEMINLGLGVQASQPQQLDFDPLSSGGGGSDAFGAAPQTSQGTLGFASDPFATTTTVPTTTPFSPAPAGQNPTSWAAFSPVNNAPSGFPATQQQQPATSMGGFGGSSPFGAQTTQPTQPVQSSNPFGGGFGASGFGAPANSFAAPATTNAFTAPPGGQAFSGPQAGFGGDPFSGSSGGSMLAPNVIEQPKEPEAPTPPKRQDMFSNLVDDFGVDFGKKKEEAPPPKMSDLAAKQQVFGESEGFGDSYPFDTSAIKAGQMETAPNVYTKQISFSESDNDLSPDREVPAPTLPPPPLPSSVHSSQSTLHYQPHSPAPTPPPRPGSSQRSSVSHTPPMSRRDIDTPPIHRNQTTPPIHKGQTTPPIHRGQTVDLGTLPQSNPPPPPPRPGLNRQTVSYSAVPRPHPSPKLRRSPGAIESPGMRHSPHNSPLLQRQITAPALNQAISRSPHQTRRFHSEQTNAQHNTTPPTNRKQELFPPEATHVQPEAQPFKADFSNFTNPPPGASGGQFETNFADFSQFSQQLSQTSSEGVFEGSPPPPPPRSGPDRQRAPKLSAESRSLTMPVHGGESHDQMGSCGALDTSDQRNTESKTIDPFALTLPNPKKSRNVESTYARPRPKARSKTPTLISTKPKSKSKSSLMSTLRSDSPLSQNSASSRELEDSNAMKITHKPEQSPREHRLSGQQQRSGTPVSLHSMQSASSGQSSEPTPDPFAHIDPFETRDASDPFEKDPFGGPDPFKSPSDPFTKDLGQSEFKTQAIAITADGLEVSEKSCDPVVNGDRKLKPDPDPFGKDPFSLGSDPFKDKASLQLGQPLIGGSGQVIAEKTVDPFDTAHVTVGLGKPLQKQPEFSNNMDSGIAASQSHTDNQDLFRNFASSDINDKQTTQGTSTWAADFTGFSENSNTSQPPSQTTQPNNSVNLSNNQMILPSSNHSNQQVILPPSSSHHNSPANHPGCHGALPPRERHESDSTSYNSEISEAFGSVAVTSPSLTNQSAALNGRGTPGNPFMTNHTTSTPAQEEEGRHV